MLQRATFLQHDVAQDIGAPRAVQAQEFRDGCRELGVAVGRDFPPMEKSYARISLGRMEDMEKAMPIFKQVLGKTSV